jgi:hypothetical protein
MTDDCIPPVVQHAITNAVDVTLTALGMKPDRVAEVNLYKSSDGLDASIIVGIYLTESSERVLAAVAELRAALIADTDYQKFTNEVIGKQ